MNALPLFNMTASPLCACGERLTHPDEIKAGSCFFCMADASEGEPEGIEVRVELAEMLNFRSHHFHHSPFSMKGLTA
jgi:hypothetical protein